MFDKKKKKNSYVYKGSFYIRNLTSYVTRSSLYEKFLTKWVYNYP